MTSPITRRRFLIASTLTLGATSAAPIVGSSHVYQQTVAGGIGWPREQFDNTYGTATESDGLALYTNPYLPESQLAVVFEDGVAAFIDVSLPMSFTDQNEIDAMVANFIPGDALGVGSWNLHSVEGTPRWNFNEFESTALSRLGSGSPRAMTTAAFNDDGIVRLTISLAMSENGTGFAPTAESVGVGDSSDVFTERFGEPYDGHAATGHYDSSYAIDPWSAVTVFSRRDEQIGAMITEVSAVSHEGVSESDAIAFANSTLPQQAELQAGYSSYPVPNRSQGWGMSSWQLANGLPPVLLFVVGDGEGRGTVLQTVSAMSSPQTT